jgi:hypothetical protein
MPPSPPDHGNFLIFVIYGVPTSPKLLGIVSCEVLYVLAFNTIVFLPAAELEVMALRIISVSLWQIDTESLPVASGVLTNTQSFSVLAFLKGTLTTSIVLCMIPSSTSYASD